MRAVAPGVTVRQEIRKSRRQDRPAAARAPAEIFRGRTCWAVYPIAPGRDRGDRGGPGRVWHRQGDRQPLGWSPWHQPAPSAHGGGPMSEPEDSMEEPDPGILVILAVLFEGGLAPLAVLLG